jgi:NDP-sugar pyrophosphorylase family protein
MVAPEHFFELSDDRSLEMFAGVHHVWELLPRLSDLLSAWLASCHVVEGEVMDGAILGSGPVHVARGARVEPGAYIAGPAYIGPGAVVRHGAYVRENCILLADAVLGHASEMKNSVLLPAAKAPHFAYVGDSILGNRVNLGAGTKLSNATVIGSRSVHVTVDGVSYDTGLRKLGAIIGDDTRLGCNVVTNPGTLLGPGVVAYAGASIRGYHAAGTILKLRQHVEASERLSGPPTQDLSSTSHPHS